MKRRFIYFLVATSLVTAGCSSDFLDPVRNTNVITSEDIANNVDVNPALVEGSLNGIGSLLINYVMDYSKKNLPNLHLACYENLVSFYEKKGWIVLNKNKDDILDMTPWNIMKLF